MAHHDFSARQLEILHAEREAFGDAHPRAIHEARHESVQTVHAAEHGANLRVGQYRRQSVRALGADDLGEPGQLDAEYFAIEEKYCGERLILSRGRDMPLIGKGREECGHLAGAEIARMTAAVIADVTRDPMGIRSLGTDAVVTHTDAFPDSVEETWRGRGRGWRHHKPFEFEGNRQIKRVPGGWRQVVL